MPREAILVVEDEELVRGLMCRALAQAGYLVDDVASGEEALERLEHRLYDLLVVDLNLPGIGGLELLDKAGEAAHRAGVLIVTGYGSLNRILESIDVGTQGFMLKPFTSEELVASVRSNLARRHLREQAQRLIAYGPLMEIRRLMFTSRSLADFASGLVGSVLAATGADQGAFLVVRDGGLIPVSSLGIEISSGASGPEALRRLEALHEEMEELNGAAHTVLSWPDLLPISSGRLGSYRGLGVPVSHGGRVTGLLVLGNARSGGSFSRADLELLWLTCVLAAAHIDRLPDRLPSRHPESGIP